MSDLTIIVRMASIVIIVVVIAAIIIVCVICKTMLFLQKERNRTETEIAKTFATSGKGYDMETANFSAKKNENGCKMTYKSKQNRASILSFFRSISSSMLSHLTQKNNEYDE